MRRPASRAELCRAQPLPAARRRGRVALTTVALLAAAAAGCGSGSERDTRAPAGAITTGLASLPDHPEVRRSVFIVDLERLRRAYPSAGDLRRALPGVWLPDAAVGADSPAWRDAFGFGIADLDQVAAAGYHPESVTVARGALDPVAVRAALERAGCRTRGAHSWCRRDGAFDASTPTGRLVLSAVNHVDVSSTRLITASTAALARSADEPTTSLADDAGLAALGSALDPVTSAVILDSTLVRPPAGAPIAILPRHAARRLAVALDDRGADGRTLKIGLLYESADLARSDADRLRPKIASAPLSARGLGRSFGDLASEWHVEAVDRAIVVTAALARDRDPAIWRALAETGDLAALVRQTREAR